MAKPPTLAFLRTEAGAGALLAAAAALGLLLANSRFAGDYAALAGAPLVVRVGGFMQSLSLAEWVRQGFMAAFFLVVGLQVKFEAVKGEVSSPRRTLLPLISAAGGLAASALTCMAIDGAASAASLWLTPAATDAAIALFVFTLVGQGLPDSLRLFLLVVAVADDLAAVAIAGVSTSAHLHPHALLGALAVLAALVVLGAWRGAPRLFYAVGFVLVWALTLQGGLTTSLAGLACAMVTPIGARRGGQQSVVKTFTDGLHPYVAFVILPLFAFTAAGVSLNPSAWRGGLAVPAVGVFVGLVIAKPAGVFLSALAAATLRLGRKPLDATWGEMAGVALLCGVGLTMSLFVERISPVAPRSSAVTLAILLGSALSVLLGAAVLRLARRARLGLRRDERDLERYSASRRA